MLNNNTGWETVQESDLRRFLRGAEPGWRASDLAAAENKLRRVGIDRPETLVEALVPQRFDPDRVVLNDMFELEDLVPFSAATLEALLDQSARPLPKPRLVTQERDKPAAQAAAQEVEPPSRLSRFFEGDGDDDKAGETPSLAEQRRRYLERKTQTEDASTRRQKQLEAFKRQGREMARAEFEASWRETELQDEDETFEVIHSSAFIKEAPNSNAPDLGTVRRGDFLQVRPRRVQDESGHKWVELTPLELLRSCNAARGTVTAGFVLIDGSHIGLGPLLQGPVLRHGEPAPPPVEAPQASIQLPQVPETPQPPPERDQKDELPTQPVVNVPEPQPPAKPDKAEEPISAQPEPTAPRPRPQQKVGSGKAPQLAAHSFRVTHRDGIPVREGPSDQEAQTCLIPCGEVLDLEEETFDGWAKLAAYEGWVRRCGYKTGAVFTFLAPVSKEPLMATRDVLPEPGPRQFEVIFRPKVAVKLAPRPTAKLLGNKAFGDCVLGVSQTYDGWVRLAGGEGWVLGIGRESGQMLR